MPPENERRPGEGAPNELPGAGGHADKENVVNRSPEAKTDNQRDTTIEFLGALFGDPLEGLIEVRLIEEKQPGTKRRPEVVLREWYESVGKLVGDLPRLLPIAEAKRAAVFFGVLPRRAKSKGKAGDTLPSCIVWGDLDFHDFKGGEAEARERLDSFPLPPSILVGSGHGLHPYWLLREPEDPEELSRLAKRLAKFVGGDHVFDAARILRLPGTLNLKNPDNPVPVEIEILEPDRRYNSGEVEEALDLISVVEDAPESFFPEAGQAVPERSPKLSARVRDLIAAKPRIANLFVGKGKPETAHNGRVLDASSSGYDYSFVIALAKAGVRDAGELAAALAQRPDGRALEKGPEYIQRTVQRALDQFKVSSEKSLTDLVDFEVERFRVFKSEPATYEFTIEGHQIVLSSSQLRRPGTVATAFLDVLHRIPAIPSGSKWAELVNLWLEDAEKVDMPPEASSEQALREDIERLVEELPVGEEVSDLDHGRALAAEGTKAFKAKALMRVLHDDYPALGNHRLCKTLRDLGFDSSTVRFNGQPARVWRRVTNLPICARGKNEGASDVV